MVTARISAALEGLDGPQRDELNLAECVVLMSASAFFTGLSPQECEGIASNARARTFARNPQPGSYSNRQREAVSEC